jgi:hypothetical protein
MTLLDQLAEVVVPSSIAASALLGLLIGAFYGYYLRPSGPPIYPFALLFIGWAFIATFTAWSVATGAVFEPVYQLGRAILWAVTCSSIPIGRYGRHLIDVWRYPR